MNFPTGRRGIIYDPSCSSATGATNYSLRAGLYLDPGET